MHLSRECCCAARCQVERIYTQPKWASAGPTIPSEDINQGGMHALVPVPAHVPIPHAGLATYMLHADSRLRLCGANEPCSGLRLAHPCCCMLASLPAPEQTCMAASFAAVGSMRPAPAQQTLTTACACVQRWLHVGLSHSRHRAALAFDVMYVLRENAGLGTYRTK